MSLLDIVHPPPEPWVQKHLQAEERTLVELLRGFDGCRFRLQVHRDVQIRLQYDHFPQDAQQAVQSATDLRNWIRSNTDMVLEYRRMSTTYRLSDRCWY
jgi:hypothetical protein